MRRYSVCSMSFSLFTTNRLFSDTNCDTVKSLKSLKPVKCSVLLAYFSMIAQIVMLDVICDLHVIYCASQCIFPYQRAPGWWRERPWFVCACCSLIGTEKGRWSPVWDQWDTVRCRVQGRQWIKCSRQYGKKANKLGGRCTAVPGGPLSKESQRTHRTQLGWDEFAGLRWDCAQEVTTQWRTCPTEIQGEKRNMSSTPCWHFGSVWCKEMTYLNPLQTPGQHVLLSGEIIYMWTLLRKQCETPSESSSSISIFTIRLFFFFNGFYILPLFLSWGCSLTIRFH